MTSAAEDIQTNPALTLSKDEVVNDYRLGWESRHASLIGRREVMSGKAKFGIFGDGKEVPQLALAKVFRNGDFRSGYYRDQTLMLAIGATTIREHFAQLYAHADPQAEPASAGRQMNAHFSTPLLKPDGQWTSLLASPNTSADLSPTGSQMPRLVGLAYASRLYRELEALHAMTNFSRNGEEIAFGTIGNASCAEGLFWESLNAIGVLRCPAVISIWDDDFGISVPNDYQLTGADLSELLAGFQRKHGSRHGFDIYAVEGWNYSELVRVYRQAAQNARKHHVPAVIHVRELTQPQGHSTSGSHERYKSPERLAWEEEFDCLRQLRIWMVDNGISTEEELTAIEEEARDRVESLRSQAWEAYQDPIRTEAAELADILAEIAAPDDSRKTLDRIAQGLRGKQNLLRADLAAAAHDALIALRDHPLPGRSVLADWHRRYQKTNTERYGAHLYSESERAAVLVPAVKPVYRPDSPMVQGYQIMNAAFDAILARDPTVIAFGEDVGKIGDVNQGFAGLQARYGELRVSDTGIRETTIIGQAIGMAMRGLRPIAEIQYLDYLLYALQIISDDLATLRWRSAGKQMAPVIVRTRGHRLEGIWHSGSPMGGILNLLRGMHVLVPRNMVQAAGFYNTLLEADDPGLIIEVLNGYRLKERLPDNLAEIKTPIGIPETLRPGRDVTLVTYGASCRIAIAAAEKLAETGIEAEVIDAQSLLPFDRNGMIAESLKRTNRIVFVDEDVPGGASAYMLQQVLEVQGAYAWLDSPPRTLTAQAHRPAYGSDGNYWSKPNVDGVFDSVYGLMHEVDPHKFPLFI